MADKEKINIVFFLPSLEPGGTERNVVNLLNHLDKNTYRVSLLLGTAKGDFINQLGKNISITDLNAPSTGGLFFALAAYFKKERPEIFVCAFPRINIICLLARLYAACDVKIVITEHSVFSMLPVIAKTFFRRLFAKLAMPTLARWLYPKADAIVCVSQGIADDLSAIIRDSKRIKVIYNPVISSAVYESARQPVAESWLAEHKEPIVAAAGRLVDCKDYPTLLAAFSKAVKQHPARLVILGRGPKKDALIRLCADLGISSRVEFLGFKENPYQYMKLASVFVLSSLQEGFGNVIIEAMACGTPVISTDCPVGPAEIISHEKNGLLVPVASPDSLARAIVRLLANPSLRKTLSEAGRQRAKDFSVEQSTGQYQDIFLQLRNKKA